MNYPPYNPYFPAYPPQNGFQPPRAPEMGQGYPPNAVSQPAAPQAPGQGFSSRPVTSREEALAVQVDFLGPGTLMPDLTHDVIYLKRFNPNTGSCDFATFALQRPAPEPPAQSVEFATKDDLREIYRELETLKQPRKGGKRNDEE